MSLKRLSARSRNLSNNRMEGNYLRHSIRTDHCKILLAGFMASSAELHLYTNFCSTPKSLTKNPDGVGLSQCTLPIYSACASRSLSLVHCRNDNVENSERLSSRCGLVILPRAIIKQRFGIQDVLVSHMR